jgi:hypothetical protein
MRRQILSTRDSSTKSTSHCHQTQEGEEMNSSFDGTFPIDYLRPLGEIDDANIHRETGEQDESVFVSPISKLVIARDLQNSRSCGSTKQDF